MQLKNSLDGTFNIFNCPRKKYKDRSTLIDKTTEDLLKNKITVQDFLNQLSNWQNKILELDLDSIVHESSADNAEPLFSEESNDADNLTTESQHELDCIICNNKPKNIVLLPCRHFKLCTDCFTKHSETSMQNSNSIILCPYCRQIVHTSMKIYT